MKNSTFCSVFSVALVAYFFFGNSLTSFVAGFMGFVMVVAAIICDTIEKSNSSKVKSALTEGWLKAQIKTQEARATPNKRPTAPKPSGIGKYYECGLCCSLSPDSDNCRICNPDK